MFASRMTHTDEHQTCTGPPPSQDTPNSSLNEFSFPFFFSSSSFFPILFYYYYYYYCYRIRFLDSYYCHAIVVVSCLQFYIILYNKFFFIFSYVVSCCFFSVAVRLLHFIVLTISLNIGYYIPYRIEDA